MSLVPNSTHDGCAEMQVPWKCGGRSDSRAGRRLRATWFASVTFCRGSKCSISISAILILVRRAAVALVDGGSEDEMMR